MKLILIHGNALVAIQNKLREVKKKYDNFSILEFDAKQKSFSEILPEIGTGGLFSEDRLIILQNFEDIDLEKLNDESLTVVLKYSKSLASNSKILKAAISKKAEIISLSEKDESSIFPFLDKLAEKNQTALKELESLFNQFGGQYLLTMCFYMLRRLVQTPKNLPPFVLKKIEKQKRNFPIEKIADLYKQSLETDYKIKSGLLEERIGLFLLVNKILN